MVGHTRNERKVFGGNKRGHKTLTGSYHRNVDRGLLQTGSVSPLSPSSLKSWTNESLGKREERRDMKLFPPWKLSPLTSSGEIALSLVDGRAGSSGRCCLSVVPHGRCRGRCLKERCFPSALLVILVFPVWFAWLHLNEAAKRRPKTLAAKHHRWCSDTVKGSLVGFGPGVSMVQTSTGVRMRPPCLGESLISWTRAGLCQTPSPTLPGGFRAGERHPTPFCPLFKGWYQLQSRGAFSTSLFPERS